MLVLLWTLFWFICRVSEIPPQALAFLHNIIDRKSKWWLSILRFIFSHNGSGKSSSVVCRCDNRGRTFCYEILKHRSATIRSANKRTKPSKTKTIHGSFSTNTSIVTTTRSIRPRRRGNIESKVLRRMLKAQTKII